MLCNHIGPHDSILKLSKVLHQNISEIQLSEKDTAFEAISSLKVDV